MKAAVILFPGSNREQDAARALREASGRAPAIVWHADAGSAATGPTSSSFPAASPTATISAAARSRRGRRSCARSARHAERGGLVLGICNGFQILCEAGLLPGVLMRNANRRFLCKMQHVRVENARTPFTRGYSEGQVVKFAIAHGEGNFEADDATLEAIEGGGQVAFRYCDAAGRVDEAANPNGSEHGIAGVFNSRFNVLGLMPHPENLIDPLVGGIDGRPLFAALAA